MKTQVEGIKIRILGGLAGIKEKLAGLKLSRKRKKEKKTPSPDAGIGVKGRGPKGLGEIKALVQAKKPAVVLFVLLAVASAYAVSIYRPAPKTGYPQIPADMRTIVKPVPVANTTPAPAKPEVRGEIKVDVKAEEQETGKKAESGADVKKKEEKIEKNAVEEPKKTAQKKEEKKDLLTDPFSLRVAVRSRAEKDPGVKTPKAAAEDEANVLQLKGIWVDPRMRVAFISGQALTRGDVINGWRVTEISKTEVVLVKSGRSKILKLEER